MIKLTVFEYYVRQAIPVIKLTVFEYSDQDLHLVAFLDQPE